MQVPEGFYAITPGQLNPNSHYYLSFNVGYPNAYDRALGRTGGDIMVHGICSSAGCFSMTDKQVDELRDRARGVPRRPARDPDAILSVPDDGGEYRQVPARPQYRVLERAEERRRPFRGDQDRAFGAGLRQALRLRRPAEATSWRASHAGAAKRRSGRGRRRRQGGRATKPRSPSSSPRRQADPHVYADGGQNPAFAGREEDASRPDALASGPTGSRSTIRASPSPP